MGRLRARLAKYEIDHQVQTEVANAQRAIHRALEACRRARRAEGAPSGRVARVERELSRARSALGNVGYITPGIDLDDPDFMSEDQRALAHRQRLEEERAYEAAAQAQVATEAPVGDDA